MYHTALWRSFRRLFPAVLAASFLLVPMLSHAADAAPKKPGTDLLVFPNGDKLIGMLDHEADGTVFFNSDNAGAIQAKWADLKELHTGEPFAVIKNEDKVRRGHPNSDIATGTISVEGTTLTLTAASGQQQIPVSDVKYLVEAKTFENAISKRQKLSQGITGSVLAGAGTVTSTQDSVNYNAGVALARAVPPVEWMPPSSRTLLDFTSAYGRITQPNTPTVKTNILHGDIEEDEYVTSRLYFLEQAVFDHNFAQGLDLQQMYGGGIGYTVIKSTIQELDLTATVNYTKQQFAAPIVTVIPPAPRSLNLIGATFADNYMRKLPRHILLTQLASITPQFNIPDAYSANGALALTFPVVKNLGLSVGLVDSYLHNPPSGFKSNSLQFNTGLTYSIP